MRRFAGITDPVTACSLCGLLPSDADPDLTDAGLCVGCDEVS